MSSITDIDQERLAEVKVWWERRRRFGSPQRAFAEIRRAFAAIRRATDRVLHRLYATSVPRIAIAARRSTTHGGRASQARADADADAAAHNMTGDGAGVSHWNSSRPHVCEVGFLCVTKFPPDGATCLGESYDHHQDCILGR